MAVAGRARRLALLAVGLLLVGFAFKVSAVPFHMWTPDAYEGAPTGGHRRSCRRASRRRRSPRSCACSCPRSSRCRASGCRVLVGDRGGDDDRRDGRRRAQTNVKRMLAYSSIAHGGYLLLGARCRATTSARARCSSTCWPTRSPTSARSASSRCSTPPIRRTISFATTPACGTRVPALAALMTVFLLSLGGFPPIAGFIAKWYIFSAAVKAGYYWLAIIGVLTSVVSVFFYLRIVVMMYMTEERRPAAPRYLHPGDGGARLRRCSRRSTSASCPRGSSTTRCSRFRRFSDRAHLEPHQKAAASQASFSLGELAGIDRCRGDAMRFQPFLRSRMLGRAENVGADPQDVGTERLARIDLENRKPGKAARRPNRVDQHGVVVDEGHRALEMKTSGDLQERCVDASRGQQRCELRARPLRLFSPTLPQRRSAA